MKSIFLSLIVLGALQANAGSTLVDQIYPDLNGDGLRDKVEVSLSENGSVSAKLYLAVQKYDFKLVSQGSFLLGETELGIAGMLPEVNVNNKNEIIFNQMVGSADKVFLHYTFEFKNNDLYLIEKMVEDLYFGDGTLAIEDYKTKTRTVQKVKDSDTVGKKQVTQINVEKLQSLSEVKKEFADETPTEVDSQALEY